MSQTLNFGDLKSYTPYDGDGAAALLAQDGYYKVTLANFNEVTTSTGKPMVKMTLKLNDPDLPPHVIYGQALTGGVDRNNESLARQFADVLISSGLYTKETLQAEAAKGTTETVATLLQQIINENRNLFVEVAAEAYGAKVTSKVKNFVTPELYSKHEQAGTHRWAPAAKAPSAANGASSAAAKAAASSVVADAI